jgi:hypothetical protein
MRARGDVEENHLIRTLLIVALRERDGVADVAQSALLGAAELHATGDFPVVDVKAWDDAFGEHFWGLRGRGVSLACAPRVFNCMSENPQAATPKKEVIAPHQESLAEEFVDDPPVVAPNYAEARLWLVARDPHWLFAYWDFRPAEHPEATGADGRAHFSLRIYGEEGAVESAVEIHPGAGHTFVAAPAPDRGYFAELGFFEDGIWCFLARSGNTRTPPELPGMEAPPAFATIPAGVSLKKMSDVLAHSALPGESLATTAARIQADARRLHDWTPEHERLLAAILGEDVAGATICPENPLTLAERIEHKLDAAGKAAAPMPPIPAPQPESARLSDGASSPSGSGATSGH